MSQRFDQFGSDPRIGYDEIERSIFEASRNRMGEWPKSMRGTSVQRKENLVQLGLEADEIVFAATMRNPNRLAKLD